MGGEPMMDDDFWNSRKTLAHLRQFARSRMVSPNALLISVLARAIAAAPPGMVLPATIGGHASLNLAAVMVGPSGFGKGAVEAAARDATTLPAVIELPIGSGEGIARSFVVEPNSKEGRGNGTVEEPTKPEPVIFVASEVDGLVAIAARQGSTVLPTFRSAISGETLGAANAQKHTRVHVLGHSYRACFLIGAQPEKAAPLLRDTAGTVQRLLWVDTTDPGAPDQRPVDPGQLEAAWNPRATNANDRSWWEHAAHLIAERQNTVHDVPGRWEFGRMVIGLPDEATEAMLAVQRAKLRGTPEADLLDGHALLVRAKIAAALMLLEGRYQVIDASDWELARQIISESDRVRAAVAAQLQQQDRAASRARAHAVAERDELVADRKLDRAKEAVLRWLAKGELPTNAIRSKIKADLREHLGAALAELVDAGRVVEVPVERGNRYRLADEVQGVPPVHPPSSQLSNGVRVVQGVPTRTCVKHPSQRLGPTGKCGSCIADSWGAA